jgi:hypothetical protein
MCASSRQALETPCPGLAPSVVYGDRVDACKAHSLGVGDYQCMLRPDANATGVAGSAKCPVGAFSSITCTSDSEAQRSNLEPIGTR